MSTFIAFQNLAELALITAETAYPSLPASLLHSDHIAQKWRSQTVPTWMVAQLDTGRDIDVVALIGCNATADTVMRVRIGDDPTFTTWTYDSGDMAGPVDPRYAQLIHILPALVNGLYVRIDADDPSLAYFQAGRLFIGAGVRPAINFSYGAPRGFGSLSRRSQSRGGQIYIDIGPSYRTASLSFAALSDEEDDGWVADLDRINGVNVDVLVCWNEQSANLGKDTIFGLVKTPTDRVRQAFDRNSKTYSVEERL